MSAAPEKLASLRHLLAGRFPSGAPRPAGTTLASGVPQLDAETGGLPLGALTEIACPAPSCGSHLLLGQLLASTRLSRARVALVDATDGFDPGSFAEDLLAHLVWVRCSSAAQALGATDLLVRDANLGLVVVDLRHVPAAELNRIPTAHWYRLQRAVEPAPLAGLVITPLACVPSARLRLELASRLEATAFDQERAGLAAALVPVVRRQRLQAAG
jgi:hypothetical protein